MASSREGLYLSFSMAIMVCRENAHGGGKILLAAAYGLAEGFDTVFHAGTPASKIAVAIVAMIPAAVQERMIIRKRGPVSKESSSPFTALRVRISWEKAWISAAAARSKQGKEFSGS